MRNQIIQGDCLEVMKNIPDKSVDMILCDLPYGTTACKWDTIIPFDKLWKQYKRVIKDNGAIVLTASQPFTSALVMSNIKMFKYCLIWNKLCASNPQLSKYQHLKIHEDVVIFGKGVIRYNPQGLIRTNPFSKQTKGKRDNLNHIKRSDNHQQIFKNYPKSIIKFSNADKSKRFHPTQKPVALFEYLIKTYTNEGDLILDNCAGSGTTGVACKNLNRDFILIEKEPKYVEIIKERLNNEKQKVKSRD